MVLTRRNLIERHGEALVRSVELNIFLGDRLRVVLGNRLSLLEIQLERRCTRIGNVDFLDDQRRTLPMRVEKMRDRRPVRFAEFKTLNSTRHAVFEVQRRRTGIFGGVRTDSNDRRKAGGNERRTDIG